MYQPFAEFFHEFHTPKVNPILANGIGMLHLDQIEMYANATIDSILSKCHPSFKYLGMERATPEEAFQVATRRKNNRKRQTSRREFDLSETDTFIVRLKMSWEGQMLDARYLELIYPRDAAMSRLRGSQFSIIPILRDRLFSPSLNSLFIPLTETKQTYLRTKHPYLINGSIHMEHVVWSTIHHDNKKKGDQPITGVTSCAHYLFAKFGVIETFKRFAGVNTIIVGNSLTVDHNEYPESDWVICGRHAINVAGMKRSAMPRLIQNPIRFAIPRPEWNAMCSFLMAGFFYTSDRFPNYTLEDQIYQEGKGECDTLSDETRLWRITIGLLLWGEVGEGRLEDAINKHFDSVDNYIDPISQAQLIREDVYVEDFYDLLSHIIQSFSDRIANHSKKISSMYDKQLTILPYLFLPINSMFSEIKRRLSPNAVLTRKDVETILNRRVIPETIIKVNDGHGEVQSINVTSDNKILGVTAALVTQRNSAGKAKRRTRVSFNDPTKALDSSTAEIGGHLCSKGDDATGQERLNVFATVDEQGYVHRNPKFKEILDRAQELIRRS